jgi:gliding motility-associated-like protein
MNRLKIYLGFGILLFLLSCAKEKRVDIGTHFWQPSAFSPNGDGLNDSFTPAPHADVFFSAYHITIFNDNLQVLFESDDKNAHWDPALLHQNLPTGFYEYQIIYTASEDSIHYDDYITSSQVNLINE